MDPELKARLDAAAARHDAALERGFPDKDHPGYRRELEAVVDELQQLLDLAVRRGAGALERSCILRSLGDARSDLARDQQVATGDDLAMLTEAVSCYQAAEALLAGRDPLMQAKLDFNSANALRRFDIGDVQLLRAAERRYERALEVFRASAPEHVRRVRDALDSLRVGIRVASSSARVERSREQLARLEAALEEGAGSEPVREYVALLEQGTPREVLAELIDIVQTLPASLRARDPDGRLQALVGHALALSAAVPPSEAEQDFGVLRALRVRLQREIADGAVEPARRGRLENALAQLQSLLADRRDDPATLSAHLHRVRDGMLGLLPALREMSYGRPPPAEGTRAARVRDLFWGVRSFVVGRLIEGGQPERERAELYELAKRTTELDRDIVARPADPDVLALEIEGTRPAALRVHALASRSRPMLVRPLWPSAMPPRDPNAVAFSGGPAVREVLRSACRGLGLELLPEPSGVDAADARWQQLARARVVVGDLTPDRPAERAAAAYHLGIAQASGASVVVVRAAGEEPPFDLDVPVFELDDGNGRALAEVVDEALYRIPGAGTASSLEAVAAYAQRTYGASADEQVRWTVEQLARPGGGALELVATLGALRRLLGVDAPQLIFPPWPGRYPDPGRRRLFHVMPFRPTWSGSVAAAAERACRDAGCDYVRDDRVVDPKIVPSIWDRICVATHVLVDLTGFDANVVFETGLAHTLGRDTLLVTQDDGWEALFPSIRKLRVHRYGLDDGGVGLQELVGRWLAGEELPSGLR